jgi:excisionase family DNA binding protein
MEDTKMSQTKTKTRKKPKPSVPADGVVEPTTEVFTLNEAAAYLRVTESELLRLVDDQALPCRRFGTEWRFLKSAIQDWLRTPPKRGSREAILALAGAWKDDPYVEAELEEIYRKRREDLVEDIQ